MPTFKFAKLVRDNIWQWHEKSGHTVSGQQLSGDKLRQALMEKLDEESAEVKAASTNQELSEEIGDVMQVLEDLAANQGISLAAIEEVKLAKQQRKGGFRAGRYIDTVYIPDETDKWVSYCRAAPEKYPET